MSESVTAAALDSYRKAYIAMIAQVTMKFPEKDGISREARFSARGVEKLPPDAMNVLDDASRIERSGGSSLYIVDMGNAPALFYGLDYLADALYGATGLKADGYPPLNVPGGALTVMLAEASS